MERTRVLHVTQAIGDVSQTVGGVAVVMLDQVAELVTAGFDVTVACPDLGGMPAEVAARGATYLRWDAEREPGPSVVGEARHLRTIVRDVDPDVVQLHSSKAGLVGRVVVRGRIPTIFMPHAWSFRHGEGSTTRSAVRSWERWAARWTNVILCVSDAERDAGIDAGITATYRVLSNTIDLEDPGLSLVEARSQVLPEIGTDTPVVLCVGRLTAQKGQDILLHAWPQIRRRVPSARLVIVGSGPDGEALRAAAPDDVIFIPAVPRTDVPVWTLAADVVAFPSRWEGQSIGVLESLRLGRPVVVSDCEGMAEALEGGRGSIVPIEDPPALAEALVPFVADPSFAAREGREAAAAFTRIHGERRRRNLAHYRQLVAGLADQAIASSAS